MEEVNLSIEINRLLSLRGASVGGCSGSGGATERFYCTCGLQHTAPIWKGKDEEGKRGGRGKGNEVVGCGLKPPGFTWATSGA